MLPDNVSHGGTYAGNRVAAAAREDARSCATRTRFGDDPRNRVGGPDGVRGLLDAKGLAYHLTGHPAMFGIMSPRRWRPSHHRLGDHRPRADAIAIGMQLRGAMPEPDSRSRGSAGRTPRGDTSTGDLELRDSLDAALEARAHGDLHGRVGAMSSHAAG